MLACNICGFNCVSSAEYLKHCRSHRNRNNVFFSCGHKDCGRRFSTYNSFAVHMARTHPDTKTRQTWNRSVSVQLKCSFNFCSSEYGDLKSLVSHLSGHISEGLTVTCPYGGCSKTFNVKSSFSSHICRYHKGWGVTQIAPVHLCEVADQSFPGEGSSVVQAEVIVDDAEHSDNLGDQEKDGYTESLAQFFLGLQAKYLVPASTITEIANEMKTLNAIQQEYTMDVLARELEQYGVPTATFRCLGNGAYEQSPIHKALNENGPLTTHHRRLQYYKAHYNYVQPLEVSLGYKDGQQRHYHYIPVLESLRAILKKQGVAHFNNDPQGKDDILCDVTDGWAFKSNAMFSSDTGTLQVMLFQDAFEVANPLGSAKTKHKVLAVYYTLGNFPPYQRSTIDQIQLALLCLEKDMKYFGVDTIFSKLVSDLCELEKNGIPFNGQIYKGTVVCIMGDNLGSHMIGGFTENFSSAEYFCRYCLATRDEFQSNPLTVFTHRNPSDYDEAVQFLKNHPDVSMHHGIKGDSVFNKLSSFHVCQPGLPPCLAHDLFEGVIDYDLALCLQFLIKKEKWFSYEVLNNRLKSFPGESGNKLNAVNITGAKVGGQAAQNRWLLRFVPILLHDRIKDADNAVWGMVLLMRDLVEYVCAPRLSEPQIAYMKGQIHQYVEMRKELFPLVRLRPKHHYLLHYGDLTLHFGPLIHTWTMRFESKHSYFKRCIRASKNFKNVTKSLADRHQLFQAYQSCGSFFSPQVQVSDSTKFYPELYDPSIRTAVEEFGLNSSNAVVTERVQVKGTSYGNGMFVLQRYTKGQLQLGQIATIIIKNETTVLLLLREKTASWVPELGVYELEVDENVSNLFICQNLEQLDEYYPLSSYQRGGRLLIPLKHMPTWSQ